MRTLTEPHDPLVRGNIRTTPAYVGYIPGCTKDEAAAECAAWAATSSSRDLVVYTDGSQVASRQEQRELAGKALVTLSSPAAGIPFDAEAIAALKGLQPPGSMRLCTSRILPHGSDNVVQPGNVHSLRGGSQSLVPTGQVAQLRPREGNNTLGRGRPGSPDSSRRGQTQGRRLPAPNRPSSPF